MSRASGTRPNDIEMGASSDNTNQGASVPDSRTGTIDRYETASSSVHAEGSANSASTANSAPVSSPSHNQPTVSANRRNSIYPRVPAFNPSAPGDWVVDNHRANLMTELGPSPKGQPLFRINFAEMQRMRLRKIQVKLIKHAVDMRVTNQETSPDWEKDLAEYIQAMKDYDYMVAHPDAEGDAFVATGNRVIDRWVMAKIIGGDIDRLGHLEKSRAMEAYEESARAIGESRTANDWHSRQRAFMSRLQMAASGAFLLLGPMWLMVLHKTLYTGLITTTVCVAVLGALCSLILDKPMDVLSATSAYAAVLVVFVGLTNS